MRLALRSGLACLGAFAAVVSLAVGCSDEPAPFIDPGGNPPPGGVGGTGGGGGPGGISPDGGTVALCEARPLTIAEDAAPPLGFDVAGAEGDFLVTFSTTRDGATGIFSRRIDASGALEAERTVAATGRSLNPAAIATAEGFLVAFAGAGLDDFLGVRARAIGPDGVPLATTEEITPALFDTIDPVLFPSPSGENLLAFISTGLDGTEARSVVLSNAG
ncbi:MAG: hypothetical protein H5U40_08945, partial [Polyangiaceae bacterium]|nr:hypothetical protein [Polyangiaceae bacterium]